MLTERPSRRAARRLALTLCAAAALAACAGDDDALTPGRAGAARRDSAGVTIVEHHLADSSGANAWTLSPQPLLRIGTVSGDSTQELYRVRGAGFLRGGRIAVAVDGAHELRVYDSTGALVRTVGREGGGPGEFRTIRELWVLGGDSLAVYDSRLRRLTVFDDTGAVARSTNYAVLADSVRGGILTELAGVLGDGRAVGFATDTGGVMSGFQRDTGSVLVFDATGHVVARAGRAGAREMYFGRPVNTPRGPMMSLLSSPFAHNTLFAVGRDRIYLADNARYDVRVVAPDGVERLALRADVPGLPLRDDDFRHFADSALGSEHHELLDRNVRAMREATPFDTLPALAALLVDADDRLWVEELARPGSPTRRLAVYDRDGALVGTLALPSPLRLLGAAGDRVLVLRRGESDEEYVEVYGLTPAE
ncbi:MAG TPA: 6-bladed beta-propeller [Gemmatimonadaceae bacterium]|nr:6-bladed beta-propeller [Gemmatimonadaceae bacterium]